MDVIPKSIAFQIPDYILNDLCTRFIINIPDVESRDLVRVFFQIELAHWFYLDFYCPDNSELRSVNLKEFASQMFIFCPTLSVHFKNFDTIFESWKEYKQAVPTFGGILLDPTLQFCLLVQGFLVKASWGFPKGKVNQDEHPVECAIREILEETGFDARSLIDENQYLEYKYNGQLSRLYIIPGVSQETHFEATTRQEIKDFRWFRVDHLPTHKKDNICKQHLGLSPNAFFMVIPFVKELKARIVLMLSGPPGPIGPGRVPAPGAGFVKILADSRLAQDKRRQKQQQQFSTHMNQELQDYLFPHRETTMTTARQRNDLDSTTAHAGTPQQNSSSPRHSKLTPASNKPGSPSRIAAAKPVKIKILKRDGTLTGQGNAEVQRHGVEQTSESCEGQGDLVNFSCPFWTDFTLDADQILEAMKCTKVN